MTKYRCTCYGDGLKTSSLDVSNCAACRAICLSQGYGQSDCVDKDSLTLGVNTALFWTMLVLQILSFVLITWFAMNIMRKCKGNPKWLNPIIITLIVLYLLGGWFPFVGLIIFIILLVILLVYNNKCR